MEVTHGEFLISDQKQKIKIEIVHRLLNQSYWAENIPLAVVKKSIENSICFGVYKGDLQVGFARVVTDSATFAWICDVIIDEKYRGLGLSKKLMSEIMKYDALKGLRRICLATKDAHKLYEKFGFKVTSSPQNWLEIKDNNIYKNQFL